MAKKDILLNSDGTFKIINGDFAVGDSLNQEVAELLRARKGDYKEFPLTGVGIEDFINDDDQGAMFREIHKQLQEDNKVVNNISLENGKLKIDADHASE